MGVVDDYGLKYYEVKYATSYYYYNDNDKNFITFMVVRNLKYYSWADAATPVAHWDNHCAFKS